VVFHATFADEKSQKSPLVKTLNAGQFFWAGGIPHKVNAAIKKRWDTVFRS
jgi:hypothetical protein